MPHLTHLTHLTHHDCLVVPWHEDIAGHTDGRSPVLERRLEAGHLGDLQDVDKSEREQRGSVARRKVAVKVAM